MRLALLSTVVAAALTSAAAAQPASVIGVDQAGARPVLVCDRSEASWMRACASHASSGAVGGLAAAKPVKVARQVFVCDRTAETRRTWLREFGSMTFVTADELIAAETAEQSWSAPRCMTNAEMRRFARTAPDGAEMAKAIAVAGTTSPLPVLGF